MMTLVYIGLGLYLGLFLAGKRWLTFEIAAMPWIKLGGFLRKRFGAKAKVYTPRERARDDARKPDSTD